MTYIAGIDNSTYKTASLMVDFSSNESQSVQVVM